MTITQIRKGMMITQITKGMMITLITPAMQHHTALTLHTSLLVIARLTTMLSCGGAAAIFPQTHSIIPAMATVFGTIDPILVVRAC